MKIGKKTIGEGVYFIAEFGVNHNGSLERAKEGIVAAAKAGADAIKFQTYTAEELVVKGTPKFWNWEGDSKHANQYDAYAAIGGFPKEHYPELVKTCKENNIEFLSTPFSIDGADFLNSLGMKAFKIASSDLSCPKFLRHIAKFGKPILLSTGAADIAEVDEAIRVIQKAGNNQIVVMQCTLCYPTAPENANLNVIGTYKRRYPSLEVGLSDHTLGIMTPIVAAQLGAKVIEKHFTVDKTLPDSADHWLSIDPPELKQIVEGIQDFSKLMGNSMKEVLPCEAETRKYDKRSIVAKVTINKGITMNEKLITYKRPGTGIWPSYEHLVIGKRTNRVIPKNTILEWKMLS